MQNQFEISIVATYNFYVQFASTKLSKIKPTFNPTLYSLFNYIAQARLNMQTGLDR